MPTEPELLAQTREALADLCAHGTDLDQNVHLLLMEAFNELDEVDAPEVRPHPSPATFVSSTPVADLCDALATLVQVTSDDAAGPHLLRALILISTSREAT